MSNGNDAISTMNNLSIIFDITFLALGTSIALVISWIIFLPISRPLLKIPKLLLQITIIEPIKAIFELPGEIGRYNEHKEKERQVLQKLQKQVF